MNKLSKSQQNNLWAFDKQKRGADQMRKLGIKSGIDCKYNRSSDIKNFSNVDKVTHN